MDRPSPSRIYVRILEFLFEGLHCTLQVNTIIYWFRSSSLARFRVAKWLNEGSRLFLWQLDGSQSTYLFMRDVRTSMRASCFSWQQTNTKKNAMNSVTKIFSKQKDSVGGDAKIRLCQIFPKNCMKLKEFGPCGESLAPPQIHHW